MYVTYSGWSEDCGVFAYDFFVDETRQDYTLVYGDDTIAKQVTPFQSVTNDWNNDGDVYTQFGAWFESPKYRGNTFLTPENMVCAVVAAQRKERFFDNEIKAVPSIDFPPPNHNPTIDDKIWDSERRAANRDADRNRRMRAMGIRPPNEPWSR